MLSCGNAEDTRIPEQATELRAEAHVSQKLWCIFCQWAENFPGDNQMQCQKELDQGSLSMDRANDVQL